MSPVKTMLTYARNLSSGSSHVQSDGFRSVSITRWLIVRNRTKTQAQPWTKSASIDILQDATKSAQQITSM
eukprot:900311-Amphidinium_carterae.1